MYVAFEGIDTSGKSTQIELLQKSCKDIIYTKEPGQTSLGSKIRDILFHDDISFKAEFFLFLADRAEHFEKIIKPNLNSLVISDRSFISGMAYAFCNDKDTDIEFLYIINKYALCSTLPEKIVFFDIDEETLTQRLSAKTHDNIEKRGIKYLMQVQNAMKKIISYTNIQCLHVNANSSIDTISQQIKGFLK